MLHPTSYPEIFQLIVGATASEDTLRSLRCVSRDCRRIVDRAIMQGSAAPNPRCFGTYYLLHARGLLTPLRATTTTTSFGEAMVICVEPQSAGFKLPCPVAFEQLPSISCMPSRAPAHDMRAPRVQS